MDNIKVKTNITAVKTIPELADKVDIFITMLPNHKNVLAVCEGAKGLFTLAKKSISMIIYISRLVIPGLLNDFTIQCFGDC
jgi:3-hydroxyisobutyrate dehydrogenase-like beta-hydroxyacid dehydrogenase